ncbi:stage II sporulation protein D [Paenibacillus uliginis N3/975]|uniref:Stage II sporulation protein D n=1 Tax=Paenibacillus uliginis N3/975 TaxID=1313296 RepID=A0A1X7GAT7_9BACL|nr:stage II sporulation protein D [Paenibacillus uliginis]SMF66956.1 stage II sporulation protein D [Paenibacillus uliginis N3/975]
MKDSKVRIQIPVTPEKERQPGNQNNRRKEGLNVVTGSKTPVLEWKFPPLERMVEGTEDIDSSESISSSGKTSEETEKIVDQSYVESTERLEPLQVVGTSGSDTGRTQGDRFGKKDRMEVGSLNNNIDAGEFSLGSLPMSAAYNSEAGHSGSGGHVAPHRAAEQTNDKVHDTLLRVVAQLAGGDPGAPPRGVAPAAPLGGGDPAPPPRSGDRAAPHGGQRSAPPPAGGGAPREDRTFRVRPSRFRRRGFAARRPAAPGRRVRLHPAVWAAAGLLALALAVPLLVVAPGDHKPAPPAPGPAPASSAAPQEAEEPTVSVYLTKTDTVETLPLETYIVGVVAAEMPAEFQLEALKAQAIAARTFIVQRLKSGNKSDVPDNKSDVTDTVSHQAYISKEKLEKEWAALGKEGELAKLRQAVKETKGIVMTYKGKPITASFFSTSNGYTENSEDYWKNEIPYLRSVESPWDKQISPKYKSTVRMPRDEFIERLGLSDTAIPVSTSGGSSSLWKVISYTKGNRIQEVRVGGKKFTGREIRERLDLRSSQFSWSLKDGEVEIVSYGYGHGVGMSQYGAEGMAREGYKAKEILQHYYTGISFAETSKLLSSKK